MPLDPERPIVLIACKVFEGLLETRLPAELVKQITFLDYGLHRVPAKLTQAVQEQIDQVETPSLVVLGYGLCGNGLDGVKAGKHTLLISRADDCIAIFLGSYQRYLKEFQTQPGTYYLTKGWLESGSHPLKEFQEYEEKYGTEQALWLIDQMYQHYRRIVFVAHDPQDLEAYRAKALEVAEFCSRWGMQYEEILGSERYLDLLAQMAVHPDASDPDFVVVPPGGEIRQNAFIFREDLVS